MEMQIITPFASGAGSARPTPEAAAATAARAFDSSFSSPGASAGAFDSACGSYTT